MRRFVITALIIIPVLCLLSIGVYNIPAVESRISPRVDQLRTRIVYALNPPEEAVFIPQEQEELTTIPSHTVTLPVPTPTVTITLTPIGPTNTPAPSPTPTITPTPLPDSIILEGIKYEDQHHRWNYCGPANLSMALTYWGWDGNRDVVGEYVKPSDKDKNVMPYEMQDFVETQTDGMGAIVRMGADIELIKRLLAAGFPVVAEKGYYEYDYTGQLGWLGHYQFVTGYDDNQGVFIVQDTYVDGGQNYRISYEEFIEGWRSFNYTLLIVYPGEQVNEVLAALGPWADPAWANQRALETAQAEIQSLEGIDQFFAQFNEGTSHVSLLQYVDAGNAFDRAFSLYAGLTEDELRPYRIVWYQTWPYWAYYYSGRYQDVISLADTTLNDTISEPVLEESFYWRALAKEAVGDLQGAIDDFRQSVKLNPNFGPGWDQLARLGVEG
jgi:tetratricopeptide (TPR) repeat protein